MNITAEKFIKGPCVAVAQWLAANTRCLKIRNCEPVPTVGADRGVPDGCDSDSRETGKESVRIIKDALHRGASRLDLTRAAVAAARAVLPLLKTSKSEAIAVVEAVESLVSNPNPQNTNVVSIARSKLEAGHKERQNTMEIDMREEFAFYAVVATAMASYFLLCADELAVIAVDCACEAAGPENNIAAVVTAALL